jgi:DNA-binding NtrC family response regulator
MDFRILAIDDDAASLDLVMSALEQPGVAIQGASDAEQGLKIYRHERPEIVLLDLMMPKMSGIDVLKQLVKPESKSLGEPEPIVIMLTAFGTVETAVEAMKAGAYDYLTKPVRVAELRLVVDRALEHLRLHAEVRRLRRAMDAKFGFENILGHSRKLLAILDMAARAAQSASTVLIQGQTGTGRNCSRRPSTSTVQENRHLSSPLIAVPYRRICWNRNCSVMSRVRLRERLHTRPVRQKVRMAAHSSSMRLENCRWNYR